MSLILSGTDGLSDVDGSAATPAIRGTDTNTGIFFPAADTIAFSKGGAEAMRIDSSGNVGINQETPGSRLDVKGTLRLSGSTSGYVGLAPAAAAGSTTYTLPTADGTSGQFLSTDGSATMSWASATVAATQAQQETATSTTTYVSPGRQQYHPSAAKAWGTASGNGASLLASYNVSSITDNGTGDIIFTYTTNFSSANYSVVTSAEQPGAGFGAYPFTHAVNNNRILNINAAGTFADPAGPYSFVAFGDQ